MFANLGEVNNHLLELEHTLERNCEEKALAKSMLVIMVKGLFSSLRFPYAMFPCDKVTGDLLFQPFWQASFRLERMGFKVCCKLNHCNYIYLKNECIIFCFGCNCILTIGTSGYF